MRLTRPAAAGLLALAAVIAIALAAALTPAPASAGNDISGEWTFIFGHRPGSPRPEAVCGDVVIVQTGEQLLLSSVKCWGGLEFRGGFNPATRYFYIFDCPDFCISVTGTVAEDGNSITGFHGPLHSMIAPFTATRGATPPTPLPSPVGGIAFEPDLRALALEAHEPSRYSTAVIVAITAAAAAFVALGGAAFYARRGAG
ncbi:MAG: hypothetical protein IIC89_06490 [Chloroflexi bacterium]|nr:hypothetical protein [Chloroflexota bacterium]